MHGVEVSLRNCLIGGPGLDGRPGDDDAGTLLRDSGGTRESKIDGGLEISTWMGPPGPLSFSPSAIRLRSWKRSSVDRFLTMSRM